MTKTCVVCQLPFTTEMKRKVTCSDECRKQHNRNRARNNHYVQCAWPGCEEVFLKKYCSKYCKSHRISSRMYGITKTKLSKEEFGDRVKNVKCPKCGVLYHKPDYGDVPAPTSRHYVRCTICTTQLIVQGLISEYRED